jgi:GNAT superfamily N-acetyltransferase
VCAAYQPERTETRLAEGTVFAGYLNDELAGCSMLRRNIITGLFVRKDLQRKGLGTILLDHALLKVQQDNSPVVLVYSSISAADFYQRANFKFIGRDRGGGYDTLIHVRWLGAGPAPPDFPS